MTQPVRPVVFRLAILLGATALAACATTKPPSSLDIARQGTAAEWNCSDDQISALHRPDLSPSPTPPSDVAADPQRLALWKQQLASQPATLDHPTIVQVAGCGHQQFYRCYHWDASTQYAGPLGGVSIPALATTCTYIAPPGLGAVGTATAAASVDRIGGPRTAKPAECPLQVVPNGTLIPPGESLAARVFVVAAPNTDPMSDGVRQLVRPQACALGGDLLVSIGGAALTNAAGVAYESMEFDVYGPLGQSF